MSIITTIEPNNWKDLQTRVAEILSQCGFAVEIEKTISTARGQVELDVYAEEGIKGRKYTIICECKYWKANIPQNVIHGFRTVVQDLGSNVGFIITTSDFQKGSISASEFTNVELLTWEEFQKHFFESWFEQFFITKITKELDPLMSYTEPILPKWFGKMSMDDRREYYALKDKYDPIGLIVMVLFSSYSRTFVKREIPQLPLRNLIKKDGAEIAKRMPDDILNETSYLEFLDKVVNFGKLAIADFRKLRDKYFITPTEFE